MLQLSLSLRLGDDLSSAEDDHCRLDPLALHQQLGLLQLKLHSHRPHLRLLHELHILLGKDIAGRVNDRLPVGLHFSGQAFMMGVEREFVGH